MPPRHQRSPRGTPSPIPEPTRRTTTKDAVENTLINLEKTIDRLSTPGIKAAVGNILEIVKIANKGKQNTDGLFELCIHLRSLKNAVVTPLLAQQCLEAVPALEARVNHLASELDQLARDWQKLKMPGNILLNNYEDYNEAIVDINRRIKESIEEFLVDRQVTSTIDVEDTRRMFERMERHLLSKEVQGLPHALASFDSISRNNAPICFEGTRVLVLDHIIAWILGCDHRVYLLNGIAGVGKTTIAQTIATLTANNMCLSASFFFSRFEDGRNSSRIFFPTLAYQLAQFSEDFEVRITKSLMQSPDAPHKVVAQQMKKLILEPLQGVVTPDERPVLIVLDALDECNAIEGAEILQLLLKAMPQLPPNFKLLITLRPEPQFHPVLDSFQDHQLFVLHDVEAMIVQEDIRRYLQHQLSRREVQNVIRGCNWEISPNDLEALVQAAGQLFIVASTAEKFIKDTKMRNPGRQLEITLGRVPIGGRSGRLPFAMLDQLYLQVLEAAIPPDNQEDDHAVRRFQNVVGTIITLQDPLSALSLARLVGEDIVDVQAILELLQSIIVTSSERHCPRIYHPSFPDFITDPTRCSNKCFLIETEKHHARLAEQCVDIMSQLLKRNICQLPCPDRYMKNHEMPKLKAKIDEHIPAELGYACTYWAAHLSKAGRASELVNKVDKFVNRYLLYWLEVLSLVGLFEYGYTALELARQFCASNHGPEELLTMFSNAQRFITGSYEVLNKYALHVYYSALPFLPKESSLSRMYEHEAEQSVEVLEGREASWNPLLATLVGHPGPVNSVMFSPDGTRLASTSSDNTVRLWNGVTGAEVAEYSGHSCSANCVTFSPDGTHLAAASLDNTVRLWNGMTGAEVAELRGHSSRVYSIMFSPDGTRFASASSDGTIKLWNGVTGAEVAELRGLSTWVNFNIFSPDGARLATTSSDNIVSLWNGVTGAEVAELRGYSSWVTPTMFSPDGTRLAFALLDSTIKLWDGVTGVEVAELRGHSGWVKSILFSPNGSRLASTSEGNTVRLWNGVTGVEVAELRGHSGSVKSTIFSPNGSRLASTSKDNTVRLWNGVTGVEVAKLRGHSSWVKYTMFSPDGSRLASTSEDNTVRLWDGVTGAKVAELRGHSGPVGHVMFSPDGTRLASTSSDNTVKLWNGVTGAEVAEYRGHSGLVNSIIFSPDGTRLATGSSDNTVRLWSGVTRAEVAELRAHSCRVESIAFSPDGTHFASVSSDGTIKLWSGVTGAEVSRLGGHSGRANSIIFSPDETRLVFVSSDNIVRLCNGVTGAEVAELRGHPGWVIPIMSYSDGTLRGHLGWVNSIIFSPDGTRLVSVFSDNTVRLWNGVTGAEVAVLRGHSKSVKFTMFSPDGTRFAVASYDKVMLWNGVTGAEVAELNDNPYWVGTLTFSPDGTQLVSVSRSILVTLWNGVTGARVAEYIHITHSRLADCILFFPDGSHLVFASPYNAVWLWNGVTGAKVTEWRGHPDWINSVMFSLDGTRLASVSWDNTTQRWNGVTRDSIGKTCGDISNAIHYILQLNGRADLGWFTRNLPTLTNRMVDKPVSSSSGFFPQSARFTYDEGRRCVISAPWGRTTRSSSEIPLCLLPSSMPDVVCTGISSVRIALGLEDGRIFLLSTSWLGSGLGWVLA